MTPKARCLVTAAMAGTSIMGSLTGTWTCSTHRGIVTAPQHIVDADHIGEKNSIKQTRLQPACIVHPVGQAGIVAGPVTRMGPEAC